jgi:hypothetical protein
MLSWRYEEVDVMPLMRGPQLHHILILMTLLAILCRSEIGDTKYKNIVKMQTIGKKF